MIKNYGFSAPEAIGWIRICRPGSIIGLQQQFLIDYDRSINSNSKIQENKIRTHKKYSSIMSPLKSTNSLSNRKPSLSKPSSINCNRIENKPSKSTANQNYLSTARTPCKSTSSSSSSNTKAINHFCDRVSTASNSPRIKKKKDNIRVQVSSPGNNTKNEMNTKLNIYNSFATAENSYFYENKKLSNGNQINVFHNPVSATPKFPQPRKLKRAMNAAKREIR